MKVKLKKGSHRSWCGPSALTAVTGLTYDTVTRTMRRVLHRRQITSVSINQLQRMLIHWKLSPIFTDDWRYLPASRPTMAAWMRDTWGKLGSNMHVIVTTHHVAVIKGRKYYDNSRPDGCSFKQAPLRRARVIIVWKLNR